MKASWNNGKMNGFGKLTVRNVNYEGHWKNDLPSGNFTKTGKNYTLSGTFSDFEKVNGQIWVK